MIRTCEPNKSFSPQVAFGHVFYHSNRKQTILALKKLSVRGNLVPTAPHNHVTWHRARPEVGPKSMRRKVKFWNLDVAFMSP